MPAEVWRCLANARDNIDAILGARLREVRLFGSYARGQHDDESDVDVLILVDRVDGHERDCVVDAVLRASVASVRLSPLVLTVSQLDELRARELILAEDLDREGIAL